ncbi:MAG: hypothetical protein H7Y42_19485 [Chitinophagaceae bacterium]|nr:hypothetical protein [Chitinophagaceae bacterium]
MKQNFLASLRKELENSFGRKIISSRDCIQLVEDIYKKTGETVNANTLRRFFGLVRADYPPSSSTLTILSRYCGFNSMHEIEEISSNENPEANVSKEEVLRYMVALFKHTQVVGNEEKTFFPLVEQTMIFLERNPTLIDKFQREIAKTSTGQFYYYEKLANIDRLNGYYGDGLRHYLRSKSNEEGKIFAHAMQIFRYWLTKNKEQLIEHMTEITTIEPPPNCPDHILGRLIAAKLYYANVKNESIDKILSEAKRYHAGIIASREDSPFSFPDFELIIGEALLLTGNYDEGREYIGHGKTFLAVSGQDKNTLFNLWEDFINRKKSMLVKRREGDADKSSYYNSFSRKYTTIIKLVTEKGSRTKSVARADQLAELIKETGFKRFVTLPV